MPAISSPIVMSGMEALLFTPKTQAINEPVQPPLPGRGMATKVISAICPSSDMHLLCLTLVFSKSALKKLSMNLECLRRNFVTGGRRQIIRMEMRVLPISENANADQGSMPRIATP